MSIQLFPEPGGQTDSLTDSRTKPPISAVDFGFIGRIGSLLDPSGFVMPLNGGGIFQQALVTKGILLLLTAAITKNGTLHVELLFS